MKYRTILLLLGVLPLIILGLDRQASSHSRLHPLAQGEPLTESTIFLPVTIGNPVDSQSGDPVSDTPVGDTGDEDSQDSNAPDTDSPSNDSSDDSNDVPSDDSSDTPSNDSTDNSGNDSGGDSTTEETPVVEPAAIPGQYVIIWNDGFSSVQASGTLTDTQPRLSVDLLDLSGLHTFSGEQPTADVLKQYRQNPAVKIIEPNYLYTITTPVSSVAPAVVPDDPDLAQQWAWEMINGYGAWDVTRGSEETVIAIIDSGIDLDHPDLVSKLVPGVDFFDEDLDPSDENGHGTHVAGSAGALFDNGTGGVGVCPNCKLMPLKAGNAEGGISLHAVVKAIDYAEQERVNVINMSFGSEYHSEILERYIEFAWVSGIFMTCAAGNEDSSAPSYPANYANCMAVASTNQQDQRSQFSNFGDWVDVAAPGSQIYSTILDGEYGIKNGTSMASPHVAGLAGLLASQGLDNAAIRDRLCDTADPIEGTGTFWRCGRINMLKAVDPNAEPPTPEPTTEPTSGPTTDPTEAPTTEPTNEPTGAPTTEPTTEPTNAPTEAPTSTPETPAPTEAPSNTPQPTGTPQPTVTPEPTETPTPSPTISPTEVAPTSQPTATGTPTDPSPTALIDGGFEEGTGWTYGGDASRSTEMPNTGSYSAKLGGVNDAVSFIEQTVTVPVNGQLSYVWRSGGDWDPGDELHLEVKPLDGEEAIYLIRHSGFDGFWYRRQIDLSAVAGLEVQIRFAASLNEDSPSTFTIDDVALVERSDLQ